MSDLGAFFSERSEEDQQRTQAAINNAPSEKGNRKLEFPGSYVVKVGEFVWFNKKDPTHPTPVPSPEIKITKNNALILDVSLQVCDKGTPQVPTGSSIFHSITLIPAKGADETKINNTTRFMKPQLIALTGKDKIEINEAWLKENCKIEFVETAGKTEIIKHHNMLKQVYITVDYVPDQNNRPKLKVISLSKLMPGDKSFTRKFTPEEEARTSNSSGETVASDVGDISPSEEVTSSDLQGMTRVDVSKVTKTEEDF